MTAEKKPKNKWKIFAIILLILAGLYFIFSIYMIGNISIEKDYYHDQMLLFCELSVIENDLLKQYDSAITAVIPEGCEYYVLEGDNES